MYLVYINIPKSEQSITLYYPSLIGEIPHRTDCSGTKFLAQSKGGDPIKDETIQSSVQSLTHLMRNLQNTHFISLLLPFQEILNSNTSNPAKQKVKWKQNYKTYTFLK